jgi:hypothetical protein
MCGIGLIRLRIGVIGDSCECSMYLLGSITHGVRYLVEKFLLDILFINCLKIRYSRNITKSVAVTGL